MYGNLQCRINPTGELYFDGMTLGPYDVLFVKLKRLMLEGRTPGTTTALRYQNWMAAVVKHRAHSLTGQLCKVDMFCVKNRSGTHPAAKQCRLLKSTTAAYLQNH